MPRQWRAKTLTFNLNISKQNASRAQMQIQDTSESGAVREREKGGGEQLQWRTFGIVLASTWVVLVSVELGLSQKLEQLSAQKANS